MCVRKKRGEDRRGIMCRGVKKKRRSGVCVGEEKTKKSRGEKRRGEKRRE